MARITLNFEGIRINTLDELKKNAKSAQLLSWYHSNRLQTWLEQIGAIEELKNVSAVESTNDATLLSRLMVALGFSEEQISLEESLQTVQKIQDDLEKELSQFDIEIQESTVEQCVACLQGINSPGNVYVYPNFDKTKLNNAIKAFAKEINQNDVLLQIDTTLFGSATEGALITFDNIYYKDSFESEGICPIRGEHLFSVKEDRLYKDDVKIVSVVLLDFATRMKITSLLLGLQRANENAKELLYQRINGKA